MLGFAMLTEFKCSSGHITHLKQPMNLDQARGTSKKCQTCNEDVLLHNRELGIDTFGDITSIPSPLQ